MRKKIVIEKFNFVFAVKIEAITRLFEIETQKGNLKSFDSNLYFFFFCVENACAGRFLKNGKLHASTLGARARAKESASPSTSFDPSTLLRRIFLSLNYWLTLMNS